MNWSVEIHDSRVARITPKGKNLVISLGSAYLHCSAGRPGIDPGSGWLQEIDLVISGAVIEALPSELPVDLCDGSFAVGEARWENSIPLPLAVSGAVSFAAETARGELLTVRGIGATAVRHGEPRYLDDFPGADAN